MRDGDLTALGIMADYIRRKRWGNKSFYGNTYTIIQGDSIHWILQQSIMKNKYLSYLIVKGEYKDIVKLAKRESLGKKLEIVTSDRIFSGYFMDYFNFVNEDEYVKINRDRQIGDYLKDEGLIGDYNIKIYRDNGVNYFDLDMEGVIKLSRKEVVIETNLPTLTRFVGIYDAELNTNIEFIKRGIVSGRIFSKDPKRGDVIVFKTPADNRTDYIKKIGRNLGQDD